VRVAKADLVPTEANLITAYATFREAVVACEELMATLNERPHRATRRPPAKMLAEERQHLHTLPAEPYAGALGETRAAPEDQTIGLRDVPYSTPPGHIGQEVWVRMEEVVVVGRDTGGCLVEIIRHELSTPGWGGNAREVGMREVGPWVSAEEDSVRQSRTWSRLRTACRPRRIDASALPGFRCTPTALIQQFIRRST
jgi:hypothetical protein